MSVTTTANPVSHAVLEVLADYDLHHSGNPEHPKPAADPNVRADTAETTDNPEWWPTDHRRIPPYRPVDVNLDRTQRPDGVNPIEVAFIFTMLRGVQLQAVSHVGPSKRPEELKWPESFVNLEAYWRPIE